MGNALSDFFGKGRGSKFRRWKRVLDPNHGLQTNRINDALSSKKWVADVFQSSNLYENTGGSVRQLGINKRVGYSNGKIGMIQEEIDLIEDDSIVGW